MEVNGRRRTAEVALAALPLEPGVWSVQLKGLSLDAGARANEEKTNEIRLWVSNREAETREPGTLLVTYKPKQEPPVLAFLQPRENFPVHQSRLRVQFQVRSTSPLKRVQLVHERSKSLPVELYRLKPGVGDLYELKEEREVTLAPELNHLRLEAVNEGGT